MDQPLLLVLLVAVAVAGVAFAVSRNASRARARDAPAAESPFATSTEGMKICPRCAMGNLWTERTCSACGAALKG